jgi:hypothetical protein
LADDPEILNFPSTATRSSRSLTPTSRSGHLPGPIPGLGGESKRQTSNYTTYTGIIYGNPVCRCPVGGHHRSACQTVIGGPHTGRITLGRGGACRDSSLSTFTILQLLRLPTFQCFDNQSQVGFSVVLLPRHEEGDVEVLLVVVDGAAAAAATRHGNVIRGSVKQIHFRSIPGSTF